MQVTQVTLLVVGLIVGFALGLGAGWYFWRGSSPADEEVPERPERRPARYPRSYEPSTPPQHRPSPRPRPVTALHHPNPISASVDEVRRPETATSHVSDPAPPPVAPAPPAPEVTFPPSRPEAPAPEPVAKHEERPAAQPDGPVSIGEPQAADRHLLNDLMETNRRLTADAELRLRREGASAGEQVDVARRQPDRPAVSAPADNDLLARHRKLEEDSRRMSRRTD